MRIFPCQIADHNGDIISPMLTWYIIIHISWIGNTDFLLLLLLSQKITNSWVTIKVGRLHSMSWYILLHSDLENLLDKSGNHFDGKTS